MPIGRCTAPLTFQPVINDVLRDHLGIFVWVSIDDILIFSKDADEHRRHLDLVLELLQRHQLFPVPTNQQSPSLQFPFADTSSIKMEYKWTQKRSRSFEVGLRRPPPMMFDSLCGFYQQFVEAFQAVAAPLTAMFKADFKWEWKAVYHAVFDKLKQAMISATHMTAIDPREPYPLYTSASKDCVGATLAQRCAHGKYKGHLQPIAFMSRKVQSAETGYPIQEQELLAIVLGLIQCFHLLRGPQQVHVHTDHKSLRYPKTCPRPLKPRQARCTQFLEEYNLALWYVPGLENPAADACSRLISRHLMDIRRATRIPPFVVPLVENRVTPEGES